MTRRWRAAHRASGNEAAHGYCQGKARDFQQRDASRCSHPPRSTRQHRDGELPRRFTWLRAALRPSPISRGCAPWTLALLLSRCRAACRPVHRVSAFRGCGAAPEARQALRVTPASRHRPHPHVPSNVEKPAGAQQASHGEPRPLCMSPDLAALFFGAPIISRHILPSPRQPVDTPADAHCRRVCATHLPFGLPRALDTCPMTHVGECCPARARGPGSPRVRLPCPPLRR